MISRERVFAVTAVVLAVGLLTAFASASTITQTLNVNTSGSNNNVTKGGNYTIFSLPVSFNQFNSALGPLDSVDLSWNITGSVTVNGNFKGTATYSFENSSNAQGWNIFGGSTTVNPNISGMETFAPAAMYIGNGTVSFSNFTGIFNYDQGFFPVSYSATSSGTITLTYTYGVPTNGGPVPEPAAMTLLGSGLLMLGWRLKKLAVK